MIPNRLSVKFYIQNPQTLDLAAVKPVFYRWIQEHALEGLLIDVADYKHVAAGPGLMLIGHEGDYAIDSRDSRPGVQYTRKQAKGDDLAALLRQAFRLAADAALKLIAEDTVNITVDFSEARIEFLDRLHYPNTPETLASLQETLQAFATPIFGDDVTFESANNDGRDVFALRLKAQQVIDGTKLREQIAPVNA